MTSCRLAMIAETANFQVCCPLDYRSAVDVARTCESMRKELQAKWLGEVGSVWEIKCQVVLHGSAAGYLAAVGAEGSRTVGSSYGT